MCTCEKQRLSLSNTFFEKIAQRDSSRKVGGQEEWDGEARNIAFVVYFFSGRRQLSGGGREHRGSRRYVFEPGMVHGLKVR